MQCKSYLSREDEIVINFISNDRNFVLLSNSQDLLQMGRGEHRATWVGWGVDNDSCSVLINQRLHVQQINLPILVGQKVVLSGFNTLIRRMISFRFYKIQKILIYQGRRTK